MSGSGDLHRGRLEQTFLDANVMRGQLTNDILLSLADRDVFEPRPKLSQFLSRKLEQNPERVVPALRAMVDRNRLDPRTMPALIDKMANIPELRGFAQKLYAAVEPHERGTAPVLAASQRKVASAALDGIVDAQGAVETRSGAGASRQGRPSSAPDRDRGTER